MGCMLVIENVFNQMFTSKIPEPSVENEYILKGIKDGKLHIVKCKSRSDIVLNVTQHGILLSDNDSTEYLTPQYISRISIKTSEQ